MLCWLLDTVRPLTSSQFLYGAPGSRAYSACLAVVSSALCFPQQRTEHQKWESADAVAWELVLGRVLPRLRELQGTAHLLALGGVKEQQQEEQEAQQQQQQQQQQKVQGSQHRGKGASGGGGRHTSPTTCQQASCGSTSAAGDNGGDVSQADVRSDVCPPADLALLLLMAAARTVKAGVNFHCFGSSCSNCGVWHPREPAGDGDGSNKAEEMEGGRSSSEGSEHHPHKEHPSNSCAGCSVNQSTGQGQRLSPGLKDLDQLEEALDSLLTLVHCLVVKGAWWQQAVSQHPLLLLQVLMAIADVSLGHPGSMCTRYVYDHVISAAYSVSHIITLQHLPAAHEIAVPYKPDACRHSLTLEPTS
jgi:hypothetical protein